MAIPGATTTLQDTATAVAAGVDLVTVWAPVAKNADATPRVFGNASAIYDQHDYNEGVEYAALHAERTRKPINFVGLPIATPGVIGRLNTAGNTGTSTVSVAAGGSGVLAEHDGVLTVVTGGTIGTSQIVLGLSLDGGRSTRRVRLGTAASYVLPLVGATVSFGAGTLVAGDVIATWHGTAPVSDAAGWALARAAMAAQQRQTRSIVLCGDLADGDEAADYLAQLEAYETANERFLYGRGSVYDRAPLASMGAVTYRMTGTPTISFAEVGATGDTITRSAGSFIADGFAAGDLIVVAGSASNNFEAAAVLADVAALVLTLGSDDLVDEAAAVGVTITGHEALVFSASASTVTRSRGSWVADGFRVGDSVTVAGTAGNNVTKTVAAVSATVLNLGSGLADEVVKASDVTIGAGQTKAAWMAAADAEFAAVDAAPRIDLAAGRGRVRSPFSGWRRRVSPAWIASCREYQHDVHIATWRKQDGPVDVDLLDADGNLAEWDDRVDGGAGSDARFTTFRSWANGPVGAFITQSLTRADDASVMAQTHNAAVVNLAMSVNQAATENVVGRSLVLNDDGTATTESLNTIATEVNAALGLALLTSRGEGPRASSVKWTPASDDVLNVAQATLNGVLELNLNGTIFRVNTAVRIAQGGQ